MHNTMLSLLSKPMIDTYTGLGFWRDDTIYALAAAHARKTPDAFAVRDGAGRLTYRALVDAADALARDMAARGKSGSRAPLAAGMRYSLSAAAKLAG